MKLRIFFTPIIFKITKEISVRVLGGSIWRKMPRDYKPFRLAGVAATTIIALMSLSSLPVHAYPDFPDTHDPWDYATVKKDLVMLHGNSSWSSSLITFSWDPYRRNLGGISLGRPSLTRNADGKRHIFVIGRDYSVWANWERVGGDLETFSNNSWASLGGHCTSIVRAITNTDGKMELFCRGGDGAVWTKWQTSPNGGWSGWASLGGQTTSYPRPQGRPNGGAIVHVWGTDGAQWVTTRASSNAQWANWRRY